MIESITIKNVASFDAAGIQITDFGKVNFIYGANGSGKTTLTKLIDVPTKPDFVDSNVQWQGAHQIKALVYNKDFREANFGKGSIDGVFTLGKSTKEEIETIKNLQIQLTDTKDNLTKKKSTLESLEFDKQQYDNQFKENIWSDICKKYEAEFKDAFSGVMKKETFKSKILSEFATNTSALKSHQELHDKAKTVFGMPPNSLKTIILPDSSRIITIETDNIWQKIIIGKADVEIGKLIHKLNMNDWVNEGRRYLQKDNTCPFCQQTTITKDFNKQLENYFDEAFMNDITFVRSYSEEYNQLATNLINILTGIETNEMTNPESKLNIENFSAFLKILSSLFISNRELLNNKAKEPSRSIDLVSVNDQIKSISQLVSDANKEIDAHNDIVSNFATEKLNLINDIWKYLTEEYKTKIQVFNKKSGGFQKGIDALANQHAKLQANQNNLMKQIREVNKNVTSVQSSVDEINQILKSYGFTNFEIVPSKKEKNQYQIQREDGSIAESTLSEGERTFITFLYFLQLTKGSTKQDSISDERILVIDDPISSLDSNVLFVVSSLIKEIIKAIKKEGSNIKQLILLTHNVYFHKEVSFIDGRTPEDCDTKYWILRKNNKVSEIQAFGKKTPIHSSYGLLWHELKNNTNSRITTQNIMRRIIENYFKLLGKYGDDDLINKFPSIPDKEICRALICWINDGSHGIPDDLYIEHQETTVDKYYEVFKNIFVHMGHIEHYNMMTEENRQVN